MCICACMRVCMCITLSKLLPTKPHPSQGIQSVVALGKKSLSVRRRIFRSSQIYEGYRILLLSLLMRDTITVQAPHPPWPHAFLVPTRPTTTRLKDNNIHHINVHSLNILFILQCNLTIIEPAIYVSMYVSHVLDSQLLNG